MFEVALVVDADFDRIDVYCSGGGPVETRHRFLRGSVSVNERLDPYALVARAWFSDHPPKKVWKVGDVVPRNTQVGKDWTAAPFRTKAEAGPYTDYGTHPMNVEAQMMCREDREILWIEP